MLVDFKVPATDYKSICTNYIIYKPNTDRGWLLFSQLVLKNCYWN